MRVVQDSDGESDGDLELEPSQTKVDASPKRFTSNASTEQSAGSTESLKRAFETAHRAHFPTDEREPQSSVSLPEPGGDIMRLPDGAAPYASFGLEDRDAARMIATDLLVNPTEERTASNPVLEELESTREASWIPEGTLRHDYIQHEPAQMFPEPSSTVPNATLTQQCIMDATAHISRGLENGFDKNHFQPPPSIPWSEYLTTSPADNHNEEPSSDQQRRISEPAPTNRPSQELQKTQEFLTPQLSQQSLSLVGDVPTADNTPVQNQTSQNDADLSGVVTYLQDTRFEKGSGQSTIASSNSRKNSQTLHSTPHHQSRKTPKDSTPYSDDDLADLGVPKEQYKPRPSRSRSLKADNLEKVDYSVRPEKAARASKRRKTTPVTASIHELAVSTPQRIQQICDMGFTPSTTKEALKRNDGDVTQTVDWLISNPLIADELASPNRSRGKSTASTINDQQPKTNSDSSQTESNKHTQDCTSRNTGGEPISKVLDGASTTQGAMNNDPALHNSDVWPLATGSKSPVKVQVVIPTKPMESVANSLSSSAPNRKAKRRKTTLDQPEAVLENSNVVRLMPERKRGRGRPKKTVHTAASTDIMQEDEQKASLDSTLENVESNKVGLDVSSEISEASIPVPQEAATSTDILIATPGPPLLPTRPEVSPITPERTIKSAKHDHLASSKGKVPYRVGLSKRARVAPLLRTMRK